MCGIAAIFSYHYASPEADRDELKTIRDAMSHRGPDGSGEWFSKDGRVALGHRRLSILDLSQAGSQPMADGDSNVVITFNGEIYNYREIRANLERQGHVFKSTSDTEVLMRLYIEKGERMLADLRGMFAFAIWDQKKNSLFLARDPLGVKPLYYADDGWVLRVASEVRALLAGGKVSKLKEPAGAAGFYLLGSVPEPFTLYQEIRSVPAGSFVWVDSMGPTAPKKFFSAASVFRKALADIQSQGNAATISAAVTESLSYHFVSDVPVGLFLSAGIDSGVLAALSGEAGTKNVHTLTLAFSDLNDNAQDESPLAREVAALYGTSHTEQRISDQEIRSIIPCFFQAMDQPTIDGLNTYLISRMAAGQRLKVALSGIGSDEIFGGYPSFHDVPSWVSRMKWSNAIPGAGKLARKILSAYLPSKISPKAAGIAEYGGTYEGAYFLKRGLFMPWELPSMLDEDTAEEGLKRLHLFENIKSSISPDPGTPFSRVSSMEISIYMRNQLLRDADWAGMAHSVEIRVPYADVFLLKALALRLIRLSGRSLKRELALSPKKPLPLQVISRQKTGFTVPIWRWLDDDSELARWKEKPLLREAGCHWSRRWAYQVYQRMNGL